ncbi:2195_t:CDS:1, partial [Gigaspora rosea]
LNNPLTTNSTNSLTTNQSNDSLTTIFIKINELFDHLNHFEIEQQLLKWQFSNLEDSLDNKQMLLKRKFSNLENVVQLFLKKHK